MAQPNDCKHERSNANGCLDCPAVFCFVCCKHHRGTPRPPHERDGFGYWDYPNPQPCIDKLRKWFAYLVDFIHADQCRPPYDLEGPPEKCWCCSDYLDVAKHAAAQAGLDVKTNG